VFIHPPPLLPRQLPSNWLLVRFGGPRWLGLVCIAWGVIASSFAFVRGVRSFLALRLLLGVAEAGAFPGVWWRWRSGGSCGVVATAESCRGQGAC
jgi:hypothetical protein